MMTQNRSPEQTPEKPRTPEKTRTPEKLTPKISRQPLLGPNTPEKILTPKTSPRQEHARPKTPEYYLSGPNTPEKILTPKTSPRQEHARPKTSERPLTPKQERQDLSKSDPGKMPNITIGGKKLIPSLSSSPASSSSAQSPLGEKLYNLCKEKNKPFPGYELISREGVCSLSNNQKPEGNEEYPVPYKQYIFVIFPSKESDNEEKVVLKIGTGGHYFLANKKKNVFVAGDIYFGENHEVVYYNDQSGTYHNGKQKDYLEDIKTLSEEFGLPFEKFIEYNKEKAERIKKEMETKETQYKNKIKEPEQEIIELQNEMQIPQTRMKREKQLKILNKPTTDLRVRKEVIKLPIIPEEKSKYGKILGEPKKEEKPPEKKSYCRLFDKENAFYTATVAAAIGVGLTLAVTAVTATMDKP